MKHHSSRLLSGDTNPGTIFFFSLIQQVMALLLRTRKLWSWYRNFLALPDPEKTVA